MMIFNIKNELFFIKETFRYGYGWRGVLRYLINKFWRSKEVYNFKLPKHELIKGVEIHVLCQKKDSEMLAWSLFSFINESGVCPKIIVHDDGSFDQTAIKKLERKFPELTVLPLKKADELINTFTGLTPKLLEFREHGHKLIYKLVDIFLLSQSGKVMVLDSDVLFFGYPNEILEFISGAGNCDSLISKHDGIYNLKMSDDYLKKYNILKNNADCMNSGIIVYNKGVIGIAKLLEYFENTQRKPGDYFVEMSGWGCLIAQTKFKFLPPDRYYIKGKSNQNTIAKHFTNPRRHEFYIYGIDRVKRGLLKDE